MWVRLPLKASQIQPACVAVWGSGGTAAPPPRPESTWEMGRGRPTAVPPDRHRGRRLEDHRRAPSTHPGLTVDLPSFTKEEKTTWICIESFFYISLFTPFQLNNCSKALVTQVVGRMVGRGLGSSVKTCLFSVQTHKF